MSASFEETLRRKVRDAVDGDPVLLADWQRVRRQRRRRRAFLAAASVPLLSCGSALAAGVVASGNLLWMGLYPAFQEDAGAGMDPLPGHDPAVMLLVQAISLTCLALVGQWALWWGLWKPSDLATAAHYPIDDRRRGRRALWGVAVGAVVLTLCTAGVPGYLAWANGFSVPRWAATAGLLTWQAAVVVSVALLLVGRVPPSLLGSAGVLALFGVTYGCAGRAWADGRFPDGAWAWVGGTLLPAGWVNRAFHDGLVKGQATGWLWLLPTVPLFALAWRRWPGGPVYRAFVAGDDGRLEGVPQPAFVSLKGPWRAPGPHEADRDLPVGTFAGIDWARLGWADRLLGRVLTPRERAIVDALVSWPPNLTMWIDLGMKGSLFSAAMLLFPWAEENVSAPVCLACCLLVLVAFGASLFTLWASLGKHPRTGQWTLPCPWFPVGHGEIVRLQRKWAALATLLLVPPYAAFGAFAAWRLGIYPLMGVLYAAKGLYVTFSLIPAALLLPFSVQVFARPTVGRVLLWVACATVVFHLLSVPCLLIFVSGLWPSLIGGVMLPLVSGGLLAFCVRRLGRGKVDWLAQ